MTAACSNCRFGWFKPDSEVGVCRFAPPQVFNDGTVGGETLLPRIHPSFWCGKHEPRGAIDDYKYRVDLREALAPFLRVAKACGEAAEGHDADAMAFLLDVLDAETGEALQLTAAQFIALADAVPEI